MEEGIIELDDVLVAELMENVDLHGKVGELLQILFFENINKIS